MTGRPPLEDDFHKAMVSIYQRAEREINYKPTRFIQMVSTDGGLQAARTLLHAAAVSDGFVRLWKDKRLDLSVENHVLMPKFHPLFTDQERAIASNRLHQYGFTPGAATPPKARP